jgi:hypothetical protein
MEEYAKSGLRPKYRLASKISFASWKKYLIIIDFGAIQKYKINIDTIITLPSRNLKLRFINISDASDRRFLVFIKIPEISHLRFKPRNLVKINFIPKIDIRIDN